MPRGWRSFANLEVSFSLGHPRTCRRLRASLSCAGPRQRTGTEMGHLHQAQSCSGRAGEASRLGSWARVLLVACGFGGVGWGWGEARGWPRLLTVGGDAGVGVGTGITDDTWAGGSLGALSRTCAGRPRGTPVISRTPCTPSVSQLCSTFTWLPSLMPSLLGVSWEMPRMVPRWVVEGGAGISFVGVPRC